MLPEPEAAVSIRPSRLLPPLLLLIVFGWIAARCAQDPYREALQAQISGMLEGADYVGAEPRLTAYLERYDGDEDHWFAAQAWFAMRRPGKAIDQIWSHPTLPDRPETAKRFAETGLLALGWTDAPRRSASSLEPYVLIPLVEGGNPWATERLTEYARTLEMRATTLYFFPAYRRATRLPLDVMVAAYRQRKDERFKVAAALAALHERDYPEKADDVALLQHVVSTPDWRQQWPEVWSVAAVALGRSGDAGALRTLQEVAAGLEGVSSRRDKVALALIRNGIVAGGDWSVADAQMEAAFSEEAEPMPTLWLLEALIHRYRSGDMRSEAGLVQYWTRLGPKFPDIRARMARALLLQDRKPSKEAQENWVGRMVSDLERPDASLMSHVLARSWRLRDGVPGAREAVIEALRTAGRYFEDKPLDADDYAPPFIEALRALYLYD